MLENYGLTERYINESTMYEGLTLARITAQYRGLYKVICDKGEFLGEVSGKMRYITDELAKYPTVGDFVMISKGDQGDRVTIHNILSRKSAFIRSAVGLSSQAQVIAANIDYVFICMSLNNNFSLNRLERYLSIGWDSGATPVIILTKADLCDNVDDYLQIVEKSAKFTDIITVSMFDNDIDKKLQPYLTKGKTAAFIGSSGVGKSTLINNILNNNVIVTREISKGDKGRHTTTGKEMFCVRFGGVVIDTPGMREIAIESADVAKAFDDIEILASNCRFNDCTHTSEPGCAVLKAIQDGKLDRRRFDSYNKLKRESSYDGLDSREVENKKLGRMFKDVDGVKNARKIIKELKKR